LRDDHCRHVVGKYFGSMVLGVQFQVMLPEWLTGDRIR
jgi:hypothetical protein